MDIVKGISRALLGRNQMRRCGVQQERSPERSPQKGGPERQGLGNSPMWSTD
jgi:hypothetical protein